MQRMYRKELEAAEMVQVMGNACLNRMLAVQIREGHLSVILGC